MATKHSPSPIEIGAKDKIAHNDVAETTKAEILADLRHALKEALADDLRPAMEVLDEIDREITDDADNCNRPAHLFKANERPQEEISRSNQ